MNTDNSKFGTVISGSSSLYHTLNAPIQMTKGHYYQIDGSDLKRRMSTLINSINNESIIYPTQSADDFYISVEDRTGIVLRFKSRMLYNYEISSTDPLL